MLKFFYLIIKSKFPLSFVTYRNDHITLSGLTGSPVSLLFGVRDRNLLIKNVELGEHELHLWDYIKFNEYTKDIWVPLSKGQDAQLHIKLDFVPSTRNSSSSNERVNETMNGNNSSTSKRNSIFGRISSDNDKGVNGSDNGKSRFSLRKKK
jgi:hypothetical protein